MSRQNISVLSLTLTASGAVSAHRFAKPSGAQCVDGESALGVSQYEAADGIEFAADVLGTTVVETGGAFPVGASVQSDLNGKAILKAAGSKNGLALQESTGAGQFVEILMLAN